MEGKNAPANAVQSRSADLLSYATRKECDGLDGRWQSATCSREGRENASAVVVFFFSRGRTVREKIPIESDVRVLLSREDAKQPSVDTSCPSR